MNENDPQTYEEPSQSEPIPAAHENEEADQMSNPDENQQTSHVIERSEYDEAAAHENEGTDEMTRPEDNHEAQQPAHVEEGPDTVDMEEQVQEHDHVEEGADYEQQTEMTPEPEQTAPVIEAQAEETTSTTAVEPAHPENPDVIVAPETTTTTVTESPSTTEAIVTVPSQEKPELAETGTDVGGGLLVGTALVLAGITASAKRFLKDRKKQ